MTLHIENILKTGRADIDIDGITVIAGSNNTGKSNRRHDRYHAEL